jgi:segregation and condensation protein B
MKQAVEMVDEADVEDQKQDEAKGPQDVAQPQELTQGTRDASGADETSASVQEEGTEQVQPPAPVDLDPPRLVEAALFTAGRPVGVDELALATGLSQQVVKQAARSLEQEYEERGDQTALEVHMAGAKWAMQLKTVYVQHAQSLARMEIPKKTLKTLALVAFHQPLLQSDLVDMIGSKTYDHVRELIETGLVKSRPEGLSRRLTTSPEFPEYFGIPATDTQEIRAYLAKKVGLSLSELKGKPDLSDFHDAAPASPEEVEQAARQIDAAKSGDEATGGDDAGDGSPVTGESQRSTEADTDEAGSASVDTATQDDQGSSGSVADEEPRETVDAASQPAATQEDS